MESSPWIWAFGGGVAANIVIALVSSWARAIVEIRRSHSSWRMVAAVSLFNSGPWTLLIAAVFVAFTYSEPWAPWFFGGAAIWFLYIYGLVGFAIWKQKRSLGKRNAA